MTVATLGSKRIKAEEYLAPDAERSRFTELIRGEIVVNTPSARHQRGSGYLYRKLAEWTEEGPERGEVMAPETVLVYRRSSPSAPTFDVAFELAAGEQLTSPMLPSFALGIVELFDR